MARPSFISTISTLCSTLAYPLLKLDPESSRTYHMVCATKMHRGVKTYTKH